MDQMTQPQDSRPDDASKVSPVDQGVEGLSINSQTSAGDEDHSHEKKSLLSKVRSKAKDTMHKAKDKLKMKRKKDKESGTGEEEEDEGEVENDNDDELHRKTSVSTPTSGFAADGSYVNHGKPLDTFGVNQTTGNKYSSAGDEQLQTEYDGFLRASKDETDGDSRNFTSVPTDYSSPQASVDAVMPAPVITPESVSDVGEQSSTSLGEIPEKPKEEDKVVATEAPDEHPRSSPSFGQFGDTSRDKLSLSDGREDLEPRERDSMSQELGDGCKETKFVKMPSGGITEKLREEGQQSPIWKAGRELPSDEAALPQREPEKGTDGESEPFTDKLDRELPSAEAATVSRGSEKPSERPLRDPDLEMPVPQLAEFTDTMFSSKDADGLRDGADSTGRIDDSHGHGVAGPSGSSSAYAEGNTSPSNSTAYDQDDQVQESTDPAGEKERFHDPQLDEFSLQKQASSSYTDEHGQEKGSSAENASSDVDGEEEGKKAGGTSLLASAVGSAVGAVGTKAGYYSTPEHTGSDARSTDHEETAPDEMEAADQGKSWMQRPRQKRTDSLPPITPQNSTVEGLDSDTSAPPPQSWIKKAVSMLYSPSSEKEGIIEEKGVAKEQEGGGKMDPKSKKYEAFVDASDSFVQ